jgi:hypothetical protein
MVALRLTCALLVGWFATSALADGRSASFNVSVRVIAPLRSRTTGLVAPASFVGATRSVALPCGAARSSACTAAVAAARSSSEGSAPVLVTVLTDGAPTAIVER